SSIHSLCGFDPAKIIPDNPDNPSAGGYHFMDLAGHRKILQDVEHQFYEVANHVPANYGFISSRKNFCLYNSWQPADPQKLAATSSPSVCSPWPAAGAVFFYCCQLFGSSYNNSGLFWPLLFIT